MVALKGIFQVINCLISPKLHEHFHPSFAKSAAWVVFSTATILFMPVMIETERLQLQDAQKAQKNQILLGPGSHFNSVILECVLGVF